MARRENEETVTQSVLERLIDLEPNNKADSPQTRQQSVRQLKASLRRDLEWLLNTRQIPGGVPENYHELESSLYGYGLPDVTGLSVSSSRDRNHLLRMLENTITTYEPRLSGVKVSILDAGSNNGQQIRLQIEGLLLMDPAPELISFDTVLQLSSGEYQVKGEQSAG
ncbi:MAG TPA: type VI secretion system baseplate subunit TssE [Bryobacteraceae bacterium]|nr:type VI secretion system baseplate subunit TssE [Bryobacteraceae bacterium]